MKDLVPLAAVAEAALFALVGYMFKTLHGMEKAVELIKYQLKPNGGQSVFDKVTRTDLEVVGLKQWREDHIALHNKSA